VVDTVVLGSRLLSTADLVVARFRLTAPVVSFPPLSVSVPLFFPVLPFTDTSRFSPLGVARNAFCSPLLDPDIDSLRLGTPVGGPPGPGSGPYSKFAVGILSLSRSLLRLGVIVLVSLILFEVLGHVGAGIGVLYTDVEPVPGVEGGGVEDVEEGPASGGKR
jgi:hypothetical protein